MLWNSQLPQLFIQLDLNLDISANHRRKAETAKRLSYYYDEQFEYLQVQLVEVFSEPDQLRPLFINIVRKVIYKISTVYLQDAFGEVGNPGDTILI